MIRKIFRLIFFLILPALSAAMLTGCVRDSREECEFPLRLRFSYTYNREGRDLLSEEVSTIRLFLYDSGSHRLVSRTDVRVSDLGDGNTLVWQVPPGRYHIVGWADSGQGYEISDHGDADAMRLSLPLSDRGEAAPLQAHLWHAFTPDILVNGDITPPYGIVLRKISNDLSVAVSTSDGSPLRQAIGSTVSVSNTIYNAYGAICASDAASYLPLSEAGDTDSKAFHRYRLLGLSRNDDSHLFLSYGGVPLYNGPLTALIARQPDIIFDLDDEFHVDFSVDDPGDGNVGVSVSVNGWLISEYDVSLL